MLDEEALEDIRDDYGDCDIYNLIVDGEEVVYIQDGDPKDESERAEAVILGKEEENILKELTSERESRASTEVGWLGYGPVRIDYSFTGKNTDQAVKPEQPSPTSAD